MAKLHPQLTPEKWQSLSKAHQILNIASELTRARNAGQLGERSGLISSLERAYELIELTVADPKWLRGARRELLRLREYLGEYYVDESKKPETITQLLKALFLFDKDTSLVEV